MSSRSGTVAPLLLLMVVGFVGMYLLFRGQFQKTPSPPQGYGGYGGSTVSDTEIGTATHVVNMLSLTPATSTSGGSEIIADASNSTILNVPSFQILNSWAMSLGLLKLNQGGLKEPHWHPNAHELLYCASGSANMTIFLGSPTPTLETFTVNQGEIVFIPKGYLHHVENTSPEGSSFLECWNNQKIQTVGISSSVRAIPPALENQTFHMTDSGFFEGLTGPAVDTGIGDKNASGSGQTTRALNPANVPGPARPVSRYKFDLLSSQPSVSTPGGTDTEGNISRFQVLQGLACFSIILNPGGLREPHWHPNAAELHYVLEGRGTFMTQTPGSGATETATINAGSFFYVPPGYLHYFANADNSQNLHVIAYFSNEDPQDIGFSGGISSFSGSVLGATFKTTSSYFNTMTRFRLDDSIVGGSKS